MKFIRLIRRVDQPEACGPARGMWALQRALRIARIPWLDIGGQLQPGDIPWIWSQDDSLLAAMYEADGLPFILGPNVFFTNSQHPGEHGREKLLLAAKNCSLLFTESQWYADLIDAHRNGNAAPIMQWPYPIEPQPDGPLPIEWDVLLFIKKPWLSLPSSLFSTRWKIKTIEYGRFRREELIEAARRSACCIYASDDDRGPLALAEILLTGCPAIGVPHGAPWIESLTSGVMVADIQDAMDAVEAAQQIDREACRAWAMERFSTARTVATIKAAIEAIL